MVAVAMGKNCRRYWFRRELGDLLQRFKSEKKTVFVSSHLLAEIEPLCDRVGILANGKLVACGTPDEIVSERERVAVEFAGEEYDNILHEQMDKIGAELADKDELIKTPNGF